MGEAHDGPDHLAVSDGGVAVGCDLAASPAEVRKRALKLLRLLHPDFSLNLPLKGTKKHARIETAFKKLNELRETGV